MYINWWLKTDKYFFVDENKKTLEREVVERES
jgi:hypothetical protein